MSGNKENQEISVLGRLFSLEMFLFLMGIVCLVSGIITGEPMQLFWGVMISAGSVILHFVRKKDWKKHWEEQEQMRQLYEQRERERKEHVKADKK
jgi:flagellar biosynthesis component FlhA